IAPLSLPPSSFHALHPSAVCARAANDTPFCECVESTYETPTMFARQGMRTDNVLLSPASTCERTVRTAVSDRGIEGAAETCEGMPSETAPTMKATTNRRRLGVNEWISPCMP